MPYRPPVHTESARLSRHTDVETIGEVPFPSILPLSRQPTAVNVCHNGPNVACQLAGKGAHLHGGATHTLDDELPEWQLFEAVQPLFASNLQWELQRHNRGRVGVDAETIGSENFLDFFKYEMKRLPENAPGKKLSCEVYGNCIETLTDLLDLLERLVREHILHDPELGESEEIEGNLKNANLPDPQLKERLVVSASMFTSIYSWLGVEFAAPLQSPPEPLFDNSSSNSKAQDNPAPEENKDHPKLRALGKAVSIALEDGTDLGRACSAYLRLDHSTEEFADAVDVLSSFNTCLESPDVSGGAKPHDLTYALEISRTRWEDVGPSNFSSLLFNILQKKISGCQASQSEKHQAMLRLNGFQLEDNPLAFDMFFHPCRRSNYWQESRFTPKGKNLQNFARPEFVHNLCGYIDRFPEESNPVVLSIAFDKTKLLATTADLLANAGALPEKSLEDLLGRGFFRKPTAGGAFSPGDKAVLTLSLARCLLHFFQGPWMERPWSAESVRFLQRNTSTEILDIHHPYVRYVLPNDFGTTVEPKFSKFQRVMLSFGRLLLEIETGENIALDSSLESDPDDVKTTLMDVLDRQEEPRGPYHLAVEGCLKFKASLASIQKREPKLELDHQIRKVIYTSVIKHLEQNLSCFRNHKKLLARRNLQVADRSIKTVPEVEIKASFPTQSQREIIQEIPKSIDTANTLKYTIGWVCAIAIELAAVKAILDEEYEPLPMSSSETNIYTFGRMGKHNIVIACLPSGKYGTVSAATVASEMRWHFPDLRFYLMVGIGGGVPSETNDIRLGDVVVSLPTGTSGGVIQYEFGKTVSEGKFQHTGNLNAPPTLLLNSLTHLRAINTKKLGAALEEEISRVCETDDRFNRPRQDEDRLFSASYEHPSHEKSCERCDTSKLVVRKPRGNEYPYVHYGIIASGDKVMKHAATRDKIGKEMGAICFEMEAAGLIHSLPCLVVRGICDYSDSHKSKEWQPYATVTAAAFAKKLLEYVPHLDGLHRHQHVHSYG